MYPFSFRFVILAYFLAVALLFSGCAKLPPRPDLAHEPALPPAVSGPIAELSERFIETNGPKSSGFHLLLDARAALDARLALIDSATVASRYAK